MTSLQEKLWTVAQHGKVEDLCRLVVDWGNLSKDVTFHRKSGDHVTHVMARCNQPFMLRYLRDELGVPLECTNLEGKVPLHEAATGGHPEVVSYLLSQGVGVDPLKRAGWTPLMLSCTKSSLDVVVLLVEAGAELCLRNKDGWNCFHIACREGNMGIIRYLHSKAPHVSGNVSKNGRTPLHTAALHAKFDAVRFLIEDCSLRTEARDACGSSPFLDSVRSGDIPTIKLFLDHDRTCLNDVNNMGLSCLHIAAEADRANAIIFLCSKYFLNVNIQVTTKGICEGQTPLHFACKERNKETEQVLLKLNARNDIKDAKGRTATQTSTKWAVT